MSPSQSCLRLHSLGITVMSTASIFLHGVWLLDPEPQAFSTHPSSTDLFSQPTHGFSPIFPPAQEFLPCFPGKWSHQPHSLWTCWFVKRTCYYFQHSLLETVIHCLRKKSFWEGQEEWFTDGDTQTSFNQSITRKNAIYFADFLGQF